MKKIVLLASFVLMPFVMQAQLLSWTFPDSTKGDEACAFSTHSEKMVDRSMITRGEGLIPQAATYSFSSQWPVCETLMDAVRGKAYYEFSVRTKKNVTVSLDRVEIVLRAQKNAPRNYVLMYSMDNGANFKEACPVRDISATINEGEFQRPIPLNGISELQSMPGKTKVIFRLYAWNSRSATKDNAFRIGKSSMIRPALAIYGHQEP